MKKRGNVVVVDVLEYMQHPSACLFNGVSVCFVCGFDNDKKKSMRVLSINVCGPQFVAVCFCDYRPGNVIAYNRGYSAYYTAWSNKRCQIISHI